jgi:hypothetical protein
MRQRLSELNWRQVYAYQRARVSLFVEWQRHVFGCGLIVEHTRDRWELSVQAGRYQMTLEWERRHEDDRTCSATSL